MLEMAAKALEEGLGIKREHQRILIRTAWVLFVSGHILWVCGFLGGWGLATPFARASEVDKLVRASEVTARINMQNEIRVQTRIWCSARDDEIRQVAQHRIDELRNDLFEISRIRTPEPQCSNPQPTNP